MHKYQLKSNINKILSFCGVEKSGESMHNVRGTIHFFSDFVKHSHEKSFSDKMHLIQDKCTLQDSILQSIFLKSGQKLGCFLSSKEVVSATMLFFFHILQNKMTRT